MTGLMALTAAVGWLPRSLAQRYLLCRFWEMSPLLVRIPLASRMGMAAEVISAISSAVLVKKGLRAEYQRWNGNVPSLPVNLFRSVEVH